MISINKVTGKLLYDIISNKIAMKFSDFCYRQHSPYFSTAVNNQFPTLLFIWQHPVHMEQNPFQHFIFVQS